MEDWLKMQRSGGNSEVLSERVGGDVGHLVLC